MSDSSDPALPRTATPSLRWRVALMVLGLLTMVLLALGIVTDVLVRAQTNHDVQSRLIVAAARADALSATNMSPDQLASMLGGGGLRALFVAADGSTHGDTGIRADAITGPTVPPPLPSPPRGWPTFPPVPPGWPPPPPPGSAEGTATVAVHPLPSGGRVILVADTTQATAVIRRLREVMLAGGLITVAATGLLLTAATRAALRPLDRITALAQSITAGDRGQRLRPDRSGTELGRAAAAFDEMLDALETSEQRTRQFLADAAHELRTPITGIHAAADQILNAAGEYNDDKVADSHYRRARLLLDESRRAARLVTDMLDLSRIDAGVSLDLTETDLAEIAHVERERATLLSPAISVTCVGGPSVPIRADRIRVAQIVSNLVDNARRHTPPGGHIVIEVRAIGHFDTNGPAVPGALLTVTDSGVGIPERDRERVFDRLVRLDTARDRDHGGVGLGLSIARALARAHHGDLICLPHHPGACFQLSLPSDPTAL